MVPESGCRRQTPVGFRGYLRHRNPNQQHGFGSETAHIECAALQPKVCNDVTQEQPTIQCEIKEFQYLIRPPKPPYFTTSTTRVRFNESPPDTYKICFDLLNRRSPPKSGTSTWFVSGLELISIYIYLLLNPNHVRDAARARRVRKPGTSVEYVWHRRPCATPSQPSSRHICE